MLPLATNKLVLCFYCGEAFYRVAQKISTDYPSTLPNINRFSIFTVKIGIKFVIILLKIPPMTKPQVCRYTTLWNVKCVSVAVAAFHWSLHWSVASPGWVSGPAARRTHWTFWC